MKAFSFVATIVLVCLVGVAQADVVPGNLITNGDFDTDLSGWMIDPNLTVVHDTQSPDGGNVLITATGSFGWMEQDTGYVLTEGQKLHFSFDVGSLLGDVVTPAGKDYVADVHFFSFDGGSNYTSLGLIKVTAAEVNSGLQNYTYDYTMGSTGVGGSLYLGYEVNCTGTILYDNLAITPIPEPGTVMLMITGLIGLMAYAWRKRK